MRKFFVVVLLLLAFLFILRSVTISWNLRAFKKHCEQFHHLPQLNTFEESLPKFSAGTRKKEKMGVLIFHGFTDSAYEFEHLTERLKEMEIPYYAITLPDHGLADYHWYRNARVTDWTREVIKAYDLFSQLVDKVVITANSNGCNLATYLSQHRPVEKMVFTAPAIVTNTTKLGFMQWPVVSDLFIWAFPHLEKRIYDRILNQERDYSRDSKQFLQERFNYRSYSWRSYKAVVDLQTWLDLKKSSAKEIYMYFGDRDKDVNQEKVEEHVRESGIPYTSKVVPATHLILHSIEREKLFAELANLIKSFEEN